MLNRVRYRASFLPHRTQTIIVWTATVIMLVLAIVLDHVLTGVAHQAFTALSLVLLGAALLLTLQARRR